MARIVHLLWRAAEVSEERSKGKCEVRRESESEWLRGLGSGAKLIQLGRRVCM